MGNHGLKCDLGIKVEIFRNNLFVSKSFIRSCDNFLFSPAVFVSAVFQHQVYFPGEFFRQRTVACSLLVQQTGCCPGQLTIAPVKFYPYGGQPDAFTINRIRHPQVKAKQPPTRVTNKFLRLELH
jgi:hypothetical protein